MAGRSVPLARRQLLHEPLKLGLALIGTALAVATSWSRTSGAHVESGTTRALSSSA